MTNADEPLVTTTFVVTIRHKQEFTTAMMRRPIRDAVISHFTTLFSEPEWTVAVNAQSNGSGVAERDREDSG